MTLKLCLLSWNDLKLTEIEEFPLRTENQRRPFGTVSAAVF